MIVCTNNRLDHRLIDDLRQSALLVIFQSRNNVGQSTKVSLNLIGRPHRNLSHALEKTGNCQELKVVLHSLPLKRNTKKTPVNALFDPICDSIRFIQL